MSDLEQSINGHDGQGLTSDSEAKLGASGLSGSLLESGIAVEDFLRDLNIEAEEFDTEGASDGSNGNYRTRPFRYGHHLWHLGWTDGRLGEPREINEALLRAHSKSQWLERRELLGSRLSHNKAERTRAKNSLNNLESKLALAQSRFEQMWEKRFHAYYEFSYLLAMVYVIIATILFLSDVPLTLKLVARGFDLRTQIIDPTTREVVLSVDDLFLRPRAVVLNLWEPLVLAVGIALAGVFLKFFLDEVIFREKIDDKQEKKVRITLWVILVLFLLTIGTLGWFRANIQRDLQLSEFQIHKKNVETDLRSQGVVQNEIDQVVQSLVPPSQESTLAIITFIALTITLPIIGGVCFSAGWRRFKNARHYREAKHELKRLAAEQEKTLAQLSKVEAEIATNEEWLTPEEQERVLEARIELSLNLYRHGYYRGLNVPETMEHGTSLYAKSKRAVDKMIAKKLRMKIWEDINQGDRTGVTI